MNSGWLHQVVAWMQEIQGVGWTGWLLFIGLYATLTLFFVPGSVLALASGAIYGFWTGLGLALMGNGAASLLSLLITRWFLRGWVERYFARHPAMEVLAEAAAKDGWRIVSLIHLSPIVPFSLVNYAFGLTTISLGEFVLATVLGTIPATCVYVYLGSLVGNLATVGPEMAQHRPLEWLLQGLGLMATIILTIYISRAASKALKKRLPAPDASSK